LPDTTADEKFGPGKTLTKDAMIASRSPTSRTDDLGTWLICNLFLSREGFAAMSRQLEERALRYHDYLSAAAC
jgi:hypothetical protein